MDITARTSNYDGLTDEYLRGENEKGWLYLGTGPWSIMDELAYRFEERVANAKTGAIYRQKLDTRVGAVRVLLAPWCADTVVRLTTLGGAGGYRVQCVPAKGAFAGVTDKDGPTCFVHPDEAGWSIVNPWTDWAEPKVTTQNTLWRALRFAVQSASRRWTHEQA